MPRRTSGPAGVRLHSTRQLHLEDRAKRDRIPVTSVARTLLDVAQALTPRRLEHALEEADRLELFDLGALERICARNPGHHGLGSLQRVLACQIGPPPDTRSRLERRFLDLCRDHGLPLPATNVMVEGFVVDAFWPDRGLVVELDGYAFHRARAAFEPDRRRDARFKCAGYSTLRVTDRWLIEDPAEVADAVRALARLGSP